MNDESCLIGYTGFVGGNLAVQRPYDVLINSKNFESMRGCKFGRIVCAGISAVKWKANRDPETDWRNISALMNVLATVQADKFVLISTIDVYPVNSAVDEDFDCHNLDHHAYGRHRLAFEDFCREHFQNLLIVRLPGLFGTGLKKNVIFDMMNDNCLDVINPDSNFQYYYLKNLSDDIDKAESAGLKLVNFFTEPIATRIIHDRFFADKQIGNDAAPKGAYDMWTKHASLRNREGHYLYSKNEILEQLSEFLGRHE